MTEQAVIRNPSEKFGVTIPENSAISWPIFHKILEDACEYEDSNSIDKDVEQARKRSHEKKVAFFQLKILHSALMQAVNQDVDRKFSQHQIACSCKPGQHSTSMTLKKYLLIGLTDLESCGDPDGLRSFGIARNFFTEHFQCPDKKLVRNVLLSDVVKNVSKLCKSVLSIYRQEASDKMIFPKIVKFPDLLSQDFENLKILESNIDRDKKTYLRHIDYYFESMIKGITLLCDKYELQEHSQAFFSSIAHFYAVKADAMSLKVRLLQLQILNDTYSRDSVLALKTIKSRLQTDSDKLEQEIVEKSSLLESYETVGGVFQNLVKEYSMLCVAIKNEKWALEELQKSENEK